MNTTPRRFRRGDSSPERPGLVFKRYQREKEVWVTPQKLKAYVKQGLATDALWRKTPKGIATRRVCARKQNQKPHIKAYRSAYYKQPEVRARYREKYANDPVYRAEVRAYAKSEAAKLSRKKSRAKHHEKIKAYNRKWRPAYQKNRRQNNPGVRMAEVLRHRIWLALRGVVKKSLRTEQLIGCTIPEFQKFIESHFRDGMCWERISEIDIHHVVPLALFRLEDEEQQKLAFNFRNCRPEWANINRAKGDLMEHNGKTVRARELRGKIINFPVSQAA